MALLSRRPSLRMPVPPSPAKREYRRSLGIGEGSTPCDLRGARLFYGSGVRLADARHGRGLRLGRCDDFLAAPSSPRPQVHGGGGRAEGFEDVVAQATSPTTARQRSVTFTMADATACEGHGARRRPSCPAVRCRGSDELVIADPRARHVHREQVRSENHTRRARLERISQLASMRSCTWLPLCSAT